MMKQRIFFIGGLFKSASRFAILAAAGVLAGGVAMPSAKAADLGGDCCADLEERVAELEATTARKGNRKVSLTISGQVNKAVLWIDNGGGRSIPPGAANVGTRGQQFLPAVDNTASPTRLIFDGNARISSKGTAGYRMMIELDIGGASASVSQFTGSNGTCSSAQVSSNNYAGGVRAYCPPGTYLLPSRFADAGMDLRESYWYIDHADIGKVSVGRVNTAGITGTIDLGGVGLVAPSQYALIGGGAYFSGLPAGYAAPINQTNFSGGAPLVTRFNGIRYDPPTWNGFVAGASYGEDVYWAATIRYAGEFGGIRIAASAGYEKDNDWNLYDAASTFTAPIKGTKTHMTGYALSALDVKTGLFLQGHWYDRTFDTDVLAAQNDLKHGTNWLLQGGIAKNWFGLGNTALYGEYGKVQNWVGVSAGNPDAANQPPQNQGVFGQPLLGSRGLFGGADIASSDVSFTGLGVVQNIDSAAMELYLGWRHIAP